MFENVAFGSEASMCKVGGGALKRVLNRAYHYQGTRTTVTRLICTPWLSVDVNVPSPDKLW